MSDGFSLDSGDWHDSVSWREPFETIEAYKRFRVLGFKGNSSSNSSKKIKSRRRAHRKA